MKIVVDDPKSCTTSYPAGYMGPLMIQHKVDDDVVCDSVVLVAQSDVLIQ